MQSPQIPQLNDAEKVKALLTNFFDSMSAENCENTLDDMLHRFIDPSEMEPPTHGDISNKVSCVMDMNKFFRSLEALKGELSC